MVNLFCHVTVIDILCLLIQDKAFVSHNISQNTHILFILFLGWWGLKMQRQQGLWWPSSWLWDSLWVPLSLLALKELCKEDPTGWHLCYLIIPLSQHKHVSNNYCFEAQVYLFSLVFLALSCAQLSVQAFQSILHWPRACTVYILYIRFRLVALTFKN